ncbi:hypothetical protein [Methylobacterium haplocladii]|uniref:DUF308 domain-containing protein n=1 Tax=Methylobacterium haplocladii TaxID=1176176 RepID=A0A512IMZ0_9HYPH|nr:hypothetical protein [Methylobacterium haplocladii]GEO99061.1 hypothetical protein MHA02_14490 [Methylobacterium haplocladii]GJD84094.1 hypothetical protein HPGCJGGD_1969 [Methylobacterium haplocladii]GLS60558.1 hypothetical protein GCM10007887_32390 [Methylobacterium haplocladii]
MVIALFALSLVMIVGGAAAVVQGFPYVRLESGLAMVIGGTTAASAGALLLGIAAAMLQVKKLAEALGQRSTSRVHEPATVSPRTESVSVASDQAARAPAFVEPAPIGPERVAVTAGAAGLAGISLGGMRDLLGTGDSRPAVDHAAERTVEVEPQLPNLLPPAPDEPIIADEDLFATPDDRPGHGPRAAADEPPEDVTEPDPAQEELALRPSLEETPTPSVPESVLPAAEDGANPAEPPAARDDDRKPGGLQVVGTYASGANTYVMFADGTIQADTPRGQFTFQSLDELKEFVDSGGEANARGAA